MDDDEDYSIRFRARELWEQGGEPNGTFLDFWFAAEAELKSKQDGTRSDFTTTLTAKEADHPSVDTAPVLH